MCRKASFTLVSSSKASSFTLDYSLLVWCDQKCWKYLYFYILFCIFLLYLSPVSFLESIDLSSLSSEGNISKPLKLGGGKSVIFFLWTIPDCFSWLLSLRVPLINYGNICWGWMMGHSGDKKRKEKEGQENRVSGSSQMIRRLIHGRHSRDPCPQVNP